MAFSGSPIAILKTRSSCLRKNDLEQYTKPSRGAAAIVPYTGRPHNVN